MLKTRSSLSGSKCFACQSVRKNCLDCSIPLHQLAQSLGNAVDAKDSTTFNHSEDVAKVSELLARLMGLSEKKIEMIHIAAHLHDIGKIGIPDNILKKTGNLNEAEFQQIRLHPEMGAKIIQPVISLNDPAGVADIILHHHERFNGSGYPNGLCGTAIPLGARIVALADTLSAMLQNRHYRAGTSFENAMEEIIRCSGSQFDPVIAAVMYQNMDLFKTICTVEKIQILQDFPASGYAAPSKTSTSFYSIEMRQNGSSCTKSFQ